MVEKEGALSGEESLIKGDRLNLKVLFLVLNKGWKRILYTALLVFVLTILVVIFIPNRFEAGAVILPKAGGASQLDRLGGLASLAGVNLSSMVGETSELPPDVYPALVYSYLNVKKLMEAEYNFKGVSHSMSFYEWFIGDSVSSFSDKMARYTIRLPWTIMDALKKEPGLVEAGTDQSDLILISKREAKVLKEVRSMIDVDVDSKTGLVSLRVEAEEPLLAAQMAQLAVGQLQEAIVRHQTSQVANNLAFVEERLKEQREELREAQKVYFEFLDANRNRVAERSDLRQRELNDAYNLAVQLYQSLAEQVEQARIAVKRETPAFSIIEPVSVPSEKFFPRRSLVAALGFLGGVLLGLFWVLGVALYKSIKMNWESQY